MTTRTAAIPIGTLVRFTTDNLGASRRDELWACTNETYGVGDQTEEIVEEAITALIDEETHSMVDGGTRCGIRFYDSFGYQVRKVGFEP